MRQLVTTRIVDKNTADEHGTQKLAAVRDFRQRWIILQGVRIHCPGPIESLTFCNNIAGPLRQVGKLIAEQLKSIVV
jgi:hypothetical protein